MFKRDGREFRLWFPDESEQGRPTAYRSAWFAICDIKRHALDKVAKCAEISSCGPSVLNLISLRRPVTADTLSACPTSLPRRPAMLRVRPSGGGRGGRHRGRAIAPEASPRLPWHMRLPMAGPSSIRSVMARGHGSWVISRVAGFRHRTRSRRHHRSRITKRCGTYVALSDARFDDEHQKSRSSGMTRTITVSSGLSEGRSLLAVASRA